MEPKSLPQIRDELQSTVRISRSYMHHRLKLQALKFLVVFLLYAYLWDSHILIKWTLLLIAPIGLYNIWNLWSTKFRLDRKLSNMMDEVDRVARK